MYVLEIENRRVAALFKQINDSEVINFKNVTDVISPLWACRFLRRILPGHFASFCVPTSSCVGKNLDAIFSILENLSTKVTCGVPQRSILGPLLWNILYGSTLRTNVLKAYGEYAFPIGKKSHTTPLL